MGDPSAALDETLRSFAIEPRNPATQEEILRLARVTGRWEEAIKVQGQLFALADELPEKLSVARNAAHLVEHEVKDLVRAFRAYLNAFRLAPDDEEIVAHLWRLATSIGRYHREDDSAPAVVATASAAAEGADAETETSTNGVSEAESELRADDEAADDEASDDGLDVVSEEVDVDVEVDDDDAEPSPFGEGETMVAAAPAVRADEDDAANLPTPPPVVAGSAEFGEDAQETDEAIEEIGDEELLEEELVDEEMVARPPSLPQMAHGDDDERFATPWEELAAAYESLPAEDTDDRWVYLRKIAEVWEKGQHDVDRALEALERAFRLDITDVDVRAELERIGAEYNKWERVAEIYLGAIDEFGAIETSVTLHHDAARVRERLGQIDRAEESTGRSSGCARTIRWRSSGWRRYAGTSSAGRISPTSSSSGPAARRSCSRRVPSGAPACASWRPSTKSAWSVRTRRSTRSSVSCASRPTRSRGPPRRRRSRRCWPRTRR